jgi:hypothetical protein
MVLACGSRLTSIDAAAIAGHGAVTLMEPLTAR